MGLFDYVMLGGVAYQCKDTPDQYMSTYRIDGGRLLGSEWHMEPTPDDELPYAHKLKEPDLTPRQRALYKLAGSMRRVIDKADVDLEWHGYLYLCAPNGDEYRAKFTDGNLVAFDRLPVNESEAQS